MKPRTEAARKSPALQLVELVSYHAQEAAGHSWTRLNSALCDAVTLAIEAGLPFAPDDFAAFARVRDGRWMLVGAIEHWYAHAVETGNRSACIAFEKWCGRPIFQHPEGSGRLYVGAGFVWDGVPVTVTSFNDSAGTLTACASERDGTGHSRVARRFTIAPPELLAARKAVRARTQTCPKCKAEAPAKKVGRPCPVDGCGGWIHAEASR